MTNQSRSRTEGGVSESQPIIRRTPVRDKIALQSSYPPGSQKEEGPPQRSSSPPPSNLSSNHVSFQETPPILCLQYLLAYDLECMPLPITVSSYSGCKGIGRSVSLQSVWNMTIVCHSDWSASMHIGTERKCSEPNWCFPNCTLFTVVHDLWPLWAKVVH